MEIDGELYWDGGLVSNTPLQYVIDYVPRRSRLTFQVDLFSATGPAPANLDDVGERDKDIRYSSRTRLTTDLFTRMHAMQLRTRQLLERIPEADRTPEDRDQLETLRNLPEITILELIYQQAAYEGQARDYEFSATSMRAHWDSGYRDTQATLRHKDWLTMPTEADGVVMHDIHRRSD